MEPVAVLLPIYAKDNADYIKLSINSILNRARQCSLLPHQ